MEGCDVYLAVNSNICCSRSNTTLLKPQMEMYTLVCLKSLVIVINTPPLLTIIAIGCGYNNLIAFAGCVFNYRVM